MTRDVCARWYRVTAHHIGHIDSAETDLSLAALGEASKIQRRELGPLWRLSGLAVRGCGHVADVLEPLSRR